ncbi:aryl-sulfate sulfotransferase [Halorussus caseinilyticus]|uniref:Aryl-sulfate sulfotransferase n=1 Tax=Halorussus caseinilyticus TaxID=3034025 RepID=A0ABD5WRA9_9EURY
MTPRVSSSRWHAVDRINETHFVVADIYLDRVFVLNVSNGRVEWAWRAKQEFDLSSGGAWPKDWTHVNDVEALPDGRFMVGPRNQDQVVFLDRRKGMLENWTLGADDDHSVLYEHHNPDYIPASEGGPAAASAEFGGKNGSFVASAILTVKNLIPGIVVNGLIYVLPSWVGFVELAALAGSVATALVSSSPSSTGRPSGFSCQSLGTDRPRISPDCSLARLLSPATARRPLARRAVRESGDSTRRRPTAGRSRSR